MSIVPHNWGFPSAHSQQGLLLHALMKVLHPDSIRTMPWANGLGVTREIATDAGGINQPWTWRLSLADVPQCAEFSRFPGVDRWIACVAGEGMRLELGCTSKPVPMQGAALAFAGEDEIHGSPTGVGVGDANWFLKRDRWVGGMRVERTQDSDHECQLDGEVCIAHVVRGEALIDALGGQCNRSLGAGFTAVNGPNLRLVVAPRSLIVTAWAAPRTLSS